MLTRGCAPPCSRRSRAPVPVSTSFAAGDWQHGSDSAERNLMARRFAPIIGPHPRRRTISPPPQAISHASSPESSSLSQRSPSMSMAELKVTADHLKRDPYLYVPQLTLRQVAAHGE